MLNKDASKTADIKVDCFGGGEDLEAVRAWWCHVMLTFYGRATCTLLYRGRRCCRTSVKTEENYVVRRGLYFTRAQRAGHLRERHSLFMLKPTC